jgi:carbon-monoxide dehydrogenase medium subunit
MLAPFRLHEPTTVDEASRLLTGFGENAIVYAGGTELLLAMKQGLIRRDHLINIKKIGLSGVGYDEAAGVLRVGATTTHRAIERSGTVGTHFPTVAGMAKRVANMRVRAVGTVGGNLCFAEPHSDLATVFLLYNARVRLSGAAGERVLPLEEFIVDGFVTSLRQDEVLTDIYLTRLPRGAGASYAKFAFLERPTVGVGTVIVPAADGGVVEEARVAVGCVGPRPVRATEAETVLRGAPLADGRFEDALRAAVDLAVQRCDAVDDLYGSAEYKAHLVGVLLQRTAQAAREAAQGSDAHGA